MKSQKNEGLTTIVAKVQTSKGWRMFFALVLVGALAVVPALGPAQVALADDGGGKGRTFDVSFTIWMTTVPANPPSFAGMSLAGVIGGATGDGRFAAKVLSDDLSVTNFWLGHTRMKFFGEEHAFTADVHITENDTMPIATAVITGVVTQGWLKGRPLMGEYTQVNVCPIATPGNKFGTLCFQGALHIHRGPEQE